MEVKFEVTDPRGLKVICSQKTWKEHIVSKRPWMDSDEWKELVIKTVADPVNFIYQDKIFEERHVYYRRITVNGNYMKVVVAFQNKNPGEIITATPVNNGKAGERIIWP